MRDTYTLRNSEGVAFAYVELTEKMDWMVDILPRHFETPIEYFPTLTKALVAAAKHGAFL